MDIYKAIAIVMVVYGHVLANTSDIYTGFISFVHMPIFYFVSGYFLYKELKKYSEKELLKKKCRRLLVPYFVWSFVAFAASAGIMILSKKADGSTLLSEAVQVFVYARSVWFFVQLFLAHVLFIILHKITDKKIIRAALNLIAWALLIVFCNTEILCMWKIKWLYGFLLLGYACSEYNLLEVIRSAKLSLLCISFAIFLCLWIAVTLISSGAYSGDLIYGFDEMSFSGKILMTEISVWACGITGMATLYLASLFMSRSKVFDILCRMGGYTLDIYVAHMMIIFVIKMIPMPENGVFLLSFIVAFFFLCIPIYLMAKYILRKIKLYRMVT
ncbi:MAG: acyltransferase family protein [Butyrivibrio sp.]|nr:acyltransferase family protein [Butyrivibrio sp.]